MERSVVRGQGVDRGSDFEVRRRGALLSYGASQGPLASCRGIPARYNGRVLKNRPIKSNNVVCEMGQTYLVADVGFHFRLP